LRKSRREIGKLEIKIRELYGDERKKIGSVDNEKRKKGAKKLQRIEN